MYINLLLRRNVYIFLGGLKKTRSTNIGVKTQDIFPRERVQIKVFATVASSPESTAPTMVTKKQTSKQANKQTNKQSKRNEQTEGQAERQNKQHKEQTTRKTKQTKYKKHFLMHAFTANVFHQPPPPPHST